MIKKRGTPRTFAIAFDREVDGRWIAEIPNLPGVMAYGNSKREALRKVYSVALRTLADNIEQGNALTPVSTLFNYDVAHR